MAAGIVAQMALPAYTVRVEMVLSAHPAAQLVLSAQLQSSTRRPLAAEAWSHTESSADNATRPSPDRPCCRDPNSRSLDLVLQFGHFIGGLFPEN